MKYDQWTNACSAALARIVTTKVVLRPEGKQTSRSGNSPTWDFLFHQSGMVGSAILFGNASCRQALAQFPPESLRGEFAVGFVGKLEPQHNTSGQDDAPSDKGIDAETQRSQNEARRRVKGIARLKVDRQEFEAQAFDEPLCL